MRINRIQILNLLSYEDAELIPGQYNVLVGANASGKTNILRILRFLTGYAQKASELHTHALNYLQLDRASKTVPDKPSAVKIDFTLSAEEEWMLLQFLLHDDSTREFSKKEMKNVSVVIRWPSSLADQIRPDLVALYFANDLLIMNNIELSLIGHQREKLSDFLQGIDTGIQYPDGDTQRKYIDSHGYPPHLVIDKGSLLPALVRGDILNTFFYVSGVWLRIGIPHDRFVVEYNSQLPAKYQKEIFEYCERNKESGVRITLWEFIRYLLHNSIIFVSEVRPDYDYLARKLVKYKVTSELQDVYSEVKKRFSELFGGVEVDAFEEQSFVEDEVEGRRQTTRYYVEVKEKSADQRTRKFNLSDAAAGYFEALYIFSEIAADGENVVILDEPALHLHPLKIKALGRILSRMSGSQVLVVTHSPQFVNTNLFANRKSIILVQKNSSNVSTITNKPAGFKLTLKPHHFNPEVYFCKLSIIVEGSSDESAIRAISDNLNDALGQYDIAVIPAGNSGNMIPYSYLISSYKLPHLVMVDRKGSADAIKAMQTYTDLEFIVINDDLESDLSKAGPLPKAKLDSINAYDMVDDLMKKNKADFRSKTVVAKVFDRALEKVGAKPNDIWK